jgi:SAM-dependent MidA family methyltransferase
MTPFEPALRRDEEPSLDVGDEPALVERLRDEIRASGPITFARFMEGALYEPGLGYYTGPAAGPGRTGDFLTAPETHPIFGWAVARQLEELWQVLGRPVPFVVREHGAGSGALAVAILDGLVRDTSPLRDAIRYEAVEVDERRLDEFRERVTAAGHAAALNRGSPSAAVVGLILANEVLDALPVHRVVARDGRLREMYVDWSGERFVDREAEPSTPRLEERLRDEDISLADGQHAEIALAVDDWIPRVAAELERGILLLVDYGYTARELYSARRARGTLLAYVRHRAHDDPFRNVGRQDLTAHVDVTAVERAAERAGLQRLGVTTQAEFLMGLGVGDLLSAIQVDPSTSIESYLSLRSSVVRLLDPAATGRFAVMAFGRGMAPDTSLRGFGFRLVDRATAAKGD